MHDDPEVIQARLSRGTRKALERFETANKIARCPACGHARTGQHSCGEAIHADDEQAALLAAVAEADTASQWVVPGRWKGRQVP